MSFTLCTSGAIVIKAGKYVDSTASTSGTILAQFSDEAEAAVNSATKHDWITNWASENSQFKTAAGDAAACLAAISLASYNPGGYTSRGEYEDLVNVLYDRANYQIQILKNIKSPDKNI